MDFMPLRLNSSSLTSFICALVAIILQLVAMENQILHMVDSPIPVNKHSSGQTVIVGVNTITSILSEIEMNICFIMQLKEPN